MLLCINNLWFRIALVTLALSLKIAFAVPEGEGCFLTSQTLELARDDKDPARKKIGLAERVLVFSSKAVSWTLTGGKENRKADTFLVFDAREDAGDAVVTATDDKGKTCTLTFKVVAPTTVKYTKKGQDLQANGIVGVALVTEMVVEPTDVSFYQLQVREIDAPSEELLGWFTSPPQNGGHKKWPNFITVSRDNRVGGSSSFDVAYFVAGKANQDNLLKSKLVWNIPWVYNVPSDRVKETRFFTVKQTMEILDSTGTAKVTKQAETASSTLDDQKLPSE